MTAQVYLRVCQWSQRDGGEKFHDRFVLTERGGILVGLGLDVGKEGETTNTMLLGQELFERRWKEFRPETEAFERVAEFEVKEGMVHRIFPAPSWTAPR